MARFKSFRKLNQSGFDHILMGVGFIVVIGAIGTFYLLASNALTPMWSGALEIAGPTSHNCMAQLNDRASGAYVAVARCDNKMDQKWTMVNVGTSAGQNEYQIQTAAAGAHFCVDDWQQKKATMTPIFVPLLRLYPCKSSDIAQKFAWTSSTKSNGRYSDNQLVNLASNDCIDNYRGVSVSGTVLDLYPCKTKDPTAKVQSWLNQLWFKVSDNAKS